MSVGHTEVTAPGSGRVITDPVISCETPQDEYEVTERGHSLTYLVKARADRSIGHRDAIARARRDWDAAR
ncbi:hypothetical protein [Streptomyces crystallinus]|uniref:Uncharacterized protein n=1 Tax=Streptomyces crystallinus TaxID=68191 RepID=A0ABN1GPI9_9ACTN